MPAQRCNTGVYSTNEESFCFTDVHSEIMIFILHFYTMSIEGVESIVADRCLLNPLLTQLTPSANVRCARCRLIWPKSTTLTIRLSLYKELFNILQNSVRLFRWPNCEDKQSCHQYRLRNRRGVRFVKCANHT